MTKFIHKIKCICLDILSTWQYIRRCTELPEFFFFTLFFIFDSTIRCTVMGGAWAHVQTWLKSHELCPTWVSEFSLILVYTEIYDYEKWGFRISRDIFSISRDILSISRDIRLWGTCPGGQVFRCVRVYSGHIGNIWNPYFWYMPSSPIYMEYTWYIHGYTMDVQWSGYTWYIHGYTTYINQVYTWYHDILGISMVYHLTYMHGIHVVYPWIFPVSTTSLRLLGRPVLLVSFNAHTCVGDQECFIPRATMAIVPGDKAVHIRLTYPFSPPAAPCPARRRRPPSRRPAGWPCPRHHAPMLRCRCRRRRRHRRRRRCRRRQRRRWRRRRWWWRGLLSWRYRIRWFLSLSALGLMVQALQGWWGAWLIRWGRAGGECATCHQTWIRGPT